MFLFFIVKLMQIVIYFNGFDVHSDSNLQIHLRLFNTIITIAIPCWHYIFFKITYSILLESASLFAYFFVFESCM